MNDRTLHYHELHDAVSQAIASGVFGNVDYSGMNQPRFGFPLQVIVRNRDTGQVSVLDLMSNGTLLDNQNGTTHGYSNPKH